jgi:hypothetical protein
VDPVALAAHGESLWLRLGLSALGVDLACLATAPDLPAVLGSSEDGHPLYRTRAFADVGPSAVWLRPRSRAA